MDEAAYAEVLRIPQCRCERCTLRQEVASLKTPGFCTNCGSWFDRSASVLHCTEYREPPSWDVLYERLEHREWAEVGRFTHGVQAFSVLDGRGPWWVYRIWHASGEAIYVGMTGRGCERIFEHAGRSWWKQVDHVDVGCFEADRQAAEEEAQQIRALRPWWNVQHNRRPVASG